MPATPLEAAVSRLERAIARLEHAPRPAPPPAEPDGLSARHERLRARVGATIEALDRLIAAGEAG